MSKFVLYINYMGIDVIFKRIAYINKLILKGKTGTPDELAVTIGVTSRTLYYYIKFMRENLNAPILYDSLKKTYRYTKKGEIPMKFCVEKTEKKTILR